MWAALFRAHAFHDLGRYAEAVEAYEYVDVSFFNGAASWRGVLLKDQLAICLLHIGERSRALAMFNSAINSYLKNPGLLFWPDYLIQAAQGDLKQELDAPVMKLLKQNEMMNWL